MDIQDLFIKHRTDKGGVKVEWSPDIHYYYRVYSIIFNPIKFDVTKLLELGVAYGSSLKAYREFFPNAEIWGIDNGSLRLLGILFYQILKGMDRINLINRDAFDPKTLDKVPDDFDIIIEDTDHKLTTQIKALRLYWSKLKKGGFFIIEDIFVSPWEDCPKPTIKPDDTKPYFIQRPFDHSLLNQDNLPEDIIGIFNKNNWFWAITGTQAGGGLDICIIIQKT